MRDLAINIISTKKDIDLFTNDVYFNKVKRVLDNIKKEYYITKEYCIACYNNHICIYKNKQLMLIREI